MELLNSHVCYLQVLSHTTKQRKQEQKVLRTLVLYAFIEKLQVISKDGKKVLVSML